MSNVVVLAFACAAVPAASMMLGSWLLMRVTVGERMLASFQNLSAGLVLAAVASELFPMLAESKTAASMGGLTVGFVCGLLVTFGTEKLGNWLEVRASRQPRASHLRRRRRCELQRRACDGRLSAQAEVAVSQEPSLHLGVLTLVSPDCNALTLPTLVSHLQTNSDAALPEEDPMEAGAVMSSELLSEQHRHHILVRPPRRVVHALACPHRG